MFAVSVTSDVNTTVRFGDGGGAGGDGLAVRTGHNVRCKVSSGAVVVAYG